MSASPCVRLNLGDVEDVYKRVAKHYNSESPRPIRVGSREKKEALIAASEEIRAFHHCGALSTEALAYLYESALIDRAVRRKLGTHSTPPMDRGLHRWKTAALDRT
jgi:hypothetical protein